MKDDNGIDYKEVNGVLNPDIQISNEPEADTAPLGKYGQMYYKYLHNEQPERFAALRMDGELMPLLHRVNEEAHQRVENMISNMMKNYNGDADDTMAMFRHRNAAKEIAVEVVIREFVLIMR